MVKIYLFLLCILSALPSFAQYSGLQKFGVREGLSSNTVFSTVEDKDGFIWIATEEGVDRFDGQNFKFYELPNLFEFREVNDVIHYIKIDADNQIWVVTLSGLLYKFDKGINEFRLFYRFKEIAIQAFFIDHKNELLFGTLDGTIVFNPKTKKATEIASIKEKNSAIVQDNQNRYYLATDRGIQVLDSTKIVLFDLLHIPFARNTETKSSVISSLYYDATNNRLWLGSNKLGLCAFNLINFDFIKPKGFPKLEGIYIRSIERYNNGELILGIDGEGLVIWDIENQKVTKKISDEDGLENSLNTKSIQHVFRNRADVFFISTWRGGLNVLNPEMAKFQSISHIQNNKNSLANNVVLSLFSLEEGVMGFGTDKGIDIWDKRRDSWQHLSIIFGNEEHISNARGTSVDGNGNIWATSYTDSLVLFKKNKLGKYYSSKDFPNELTQIDFNKVYAGDNNQIWLSSDSKQQITLLQLNTNNIEHFPLASGQVQTILDFSDEKLLIGTSSGIKVFNKKKKDFEIIPIINSSKLNTVMISCMAIDANRQIWVGSRYEGIFLINLFKNTITQLSSEDGLTSNRIFSIVTDNEDIWVSTAKGISKIDSKLQVSNFSKSDGLISVDFNYNTAILNDEHLYFGTSEGIITFKPKGAYITESQKNLVFDEFYLNHKRVLVSENSPLVKPLNETDQIKLKHSQNSFSIGFSSIDLLHADQGILQWRLENFDEQWVKNLQVSRASYTNLNPGSYTFRLRMVNEIGELIAHEKQLKIVIAPPFWLTYWAYLLYFMVIAIIVLFLVYLNTLKVKSKNSKEKLHYLVNIAHEIKTPLMLIKAPLTDLLNNSKMDSTMIQGIQLALKNTEKVNMQMVQFLDFRHFRLRRKIVIISSFDLIRFLKDKIFAFKILADKKNIKLSFEGTFTELIIDSDEKILDKILGNLISNAIKYTKDNGDIKVKLIVYKQKCKISVTDSGIGIPKAQRKKIFKLFYRTPEAKESGSLGTGVGLVLARDLAKLIEGKVSLEKSSPKGSVFSLVFPFKTVSNEAEKDLGTVELMNIPAQNVTTLGTKVLLVEDDSDLLEFSRKKLNGKYSVLTANDGIEALELVKKEQPHIIISDVLMPKMNGVQFCLSIKRNIETCHIPIILLTGLSSKENVMQGLESGADDYITKPYDYELLLSKIDGLLKNRSVLKKKFLIQDFKEGEIEFSNKLDESFMEDLTQLVEENISDETFSVKDMCEGMGMSRTSFYHKIKGLIDVSPNEFIRTIRLKKGRSMLMTCNYNISEVAYNVGFSDAKYFGTLFKKYYGVSPSVFLAEKKNSMGQNSNS